MAGRVVPAGAGQARGEVVGGGVGEAGRLAVGVFAQDEDTPRVVRACAGGGGGEGCRERVGGEGGLDRGGVTRGGHGRGCVPRGTLAKV